MLVTSVKVVRKMLQPVREGGFEHNVAQDFERPAKQQITHRDYPQQMIIRPRDKHIRDGSSRQVCSFGFFSS